MKVFLLLVAVTAFAVAASAADFDAKAAFAQLQSLAGEWNGSVVKRDGPKTTVDYRLTAGGKTVMETLFGGGAHEMISMYHLDGPDLVITHFCAMGNQPRMKLDRVASRTNEFHFAFSGGSNLDAAKDTHIHEGRLRFPTADRLEAEWVVFRNGKPVGTNAFFLSRSPKPSPTDH
jgi:hypothetical protein